jgi:DNA-binding transcriptional ArsR family regulator
LTKFSVSGNVRFVMSDGEGRAVWELLAEPSRRAIVMQLARRPRAVGELADELPISRPAVSQHLRAMKVAGLVSSDERGTRRVYRLNPLALAALRDQLDVFWDRALSGYTESVAARPAEPVNDEEHR